MNTAKKLTPQTKQGGQRYDFAFGGADTCPHKIGDIIKSPFGIAHPSGRGGKVYIFEGVGVIVQIDGHHPIGSDISTWTAYVLVQSSIDPFDAHRVPVTVTDQ